MNFINFTITMLLIITVLTLVYKTLDRICVCIERCALAKYAGTARYVGGMKNEKNSEVLPSTDKC